MQAHGPESSVPVHGYVSHQQGGHVDNPDNRSPGAANETGDIPSIDPHRAPAAARGSLRRRNASHPSLPLLRAIHQRVWLRLLYLPGDGFFVAVRWLRRAVDLSRRDRMVSNPKARSGAIPRLSRLFRVRRTAGVRRVRTAPDRGAAGARIHADVVRSDGPHRARLEPARAIAGELW